MPLPNVLTIYKAKKYVSESDTSKNPYSREITCMIFFFLLTCTIKSVSSILCNIFYCIVLIFKIISQCHEFLFKYE